MKHHKVTKDQIAEMMKNRINRGLGGKHNVLQEMIEDWYDALKGYEFDTIRAARKELMKRHKLSRYPLLSEFMTCVQDVLYRQDEYEPSKPKVDHEFQSMVYRTKPHVDEFKRRIMNDIKLMDGQVITKKEVEKYMENILGIRDLKAEYLKAGDGWTPYTASFDGLLAMYYEKTLKSLSGKSQGDIQAKGINMKKAVI
jgi:hypothetical protein